MNLIILHGNGINALLNKVSSLKGGYDKLSIIEKNGKSVNWDQMIVEVSTPTLFSDKRILIPNSALYSTSFFM